jgi:hypothetical protein
MSEQLLCITCKHCDNGKRCKIINCTLSDGEEACDFYESKEATK